MPTHECELHSDSRPAELTGKGELLLSLRHNRDDAGIYLMDLTTSQLRSLAAGPGFRSSPAASPDGTSIVFTVRLESSATRIYSMRRDGTDQLRLTDDRFSDALPSYLPDGRRVIFARAARHRPYSMGGMVWDDWDLWTMDAGGGNERQLTNVAFYGVSAPQVSPDGRLAVFSGDTGTGRRIYICALADDAQAAEPQPLPLPPSPPGGTTEDSDPAFSPDGRMVVFVSNRISRPSPFDYELWIVDIDGSNLRQVTHNRSMNQSPAFSRDGKSIYFLSDPQRDRSFELWRISREGTDAVKLYPK